MEILIMAISELNSCVTICKNIILDCDIGFDSDDYWALYILRNHLEAVVTTLYNPGEKKLIAEMYITQLFQNNLIPEATEEKIKNLVSHIFCGEGYYPEKFPTADEKSEAFFSSYPHWPTKAFGDPKEGIDENYKCIYPYQTKAFDDTYSIMQNTPMNQSELDNFLLYVTELENPITLVATGPLTNVAAAIQKSPALMKDKIVSIVMMNGTFMSPKRMGYNGGLNLKDTETVFESGIPCLIVPSEICDKFSLPLDKVQMLHENKEKLTQFGKTMVDVMMNWEVHRARKKNPLLPAEEAPILKPIFADPLAAFLTLHPEFIENTRTVKYTFNHDLKLDDGGEVHLFHPKANELFKIDEVNDGTVFEVTSLKTPEIIQQRLEEEILSLFPNLAANL